MNNDIWLVFSSMQMKKFAVFTVVEQIWFCFLLMVSLILEQATLFYSNLVVCYLVLLHHELLDSSSF
jgi:hypothetical protein